MSLQLRPLVAPEVPGFVREKRMETRFIAPGGLVSNLDFVESIFGNGGDPYLPENDASLAPETWTGHTGCVILAPHLTRLTKKAARPAARRRCHRAAAARRHVLEQSDDELYNDGQAFKVCARDARGVIVTIIADNYFGYCKKEVKTQISYSANLFGNAEEEHAGGALVYASYDVGQEYLDDSSGDEYSLADVLDREPARFDPQPEGHAATASSRAWSSSPPTPTTRCSHDRHLAAPTAAPARSRYEPAPRTSVLTATGSRCISRLRPDLVDPDRHGPDRHVVPQAGDSLRRRQVRDLQGDQRRLRLRTGVRRRPRD